MLGLYSASRPGCCSESESGAAAAAHCTELITSAVSACSVEWRLNCDA